MSKDELTSAYSAGQISRRAFIRGLMAVGVTAGAAVAYAETLAPSAYGQHGNPGVGTTGGSGGGGFYSGGGGSTTSGGHGGQGPDGGGAGSGTAGGGGGGPGGGAPG